MDNKRLNKKALLLLAITCLFAYNDKDPENR